MVELVVSYDTKPELVAALVDRDTFGRAAAEGIEEARTASEERRVFHTAGSASVGRIHDRDVIVGVSTEPLSIVEEAGFRRLEMPLCLLLMLRLDEKPHVHRRQARFLEPRFSDHVIGARRPCKTVNVFLMVT